MAKHNKQITLNLVGMDSNPFSLMGHFQAQARKEQWTKDEIDEVLNEAIAGNHDHLIATLSNHCTTDDE